MAILFAAHFVVQRLSLLCAAFVSSSLVEPSLDPEGFARQRLLGSFFFPLSLANLFNTSRASWVLPLTRSQRGDSETKGRNRMEYARGRRDRILYKVLQQVLVG